MRLFLLLILFFVLPPSCLMGSTLTGKVTDKSGLGLAFVSIYTMGGAFGTSSNTSGQYKLQLPPGEYQIMFKLIGYQLVSKVVQIRDSSNVLLDLELAEEHYALGEITVTKDNENPAYDIIRAAQRKRQYYLDEEVKSFTCKSYVKSLGRIGKAEIKNKVLGIKLFDVPKLPQNKIIYLSEAVSEISYLRSGKYKERMIHSKVSGQAKGYSFASAFAMLSQVNFYSNFLSMGDINERPFISPIASNAFQYYDYQLTDTFTEHGEIIHKIKVIPLKRQGPVFHGFIYIIDGSDRLHSVNLTIDKGTGVDFIDTLTIQHTFAPQNDSVWTIVNQTYKIRFDFDLQIAKANGSGYVIGVFSDYKIVPARPKPASAKILPAKPILTKRIRKELKREERKKEKSFSNELLVVEEKANLLDSVAWTQLRPVELTSEESKDYHEKDSAEAIKESKIFMDSTDRKRNKLKPEALIFGYTYHQSYKKREFVFKSIITNIQFNTMEGWVVNPNFSYRQTFDGNKYLEISPFFRYGFSNERFNAKLDVAFHYRPRKWANIKISTGRFVQDFNQNEAITPLVNSVYTLFLRENYLKMYEKAFLHITHGSEISNGIYMTTGAEYANRTALENATDYSFLGSKTYTINNPATIYAPVMPNHTALIFNISFGFTFKQKYLSYPTRKIGLGSDYPVLSINYRKGVPGISDVNFDYASIKLSQELDLKSVGEAEYAIQAGGYLRTDRMTFADYKHFNGNQTIFTRNNLSNIYWLLDYYTYSANRSYVELHWEHHLNGFITNQLPLIKRWKWQLVNSVNYLYTEKLGNYVECAVGIEHIFKYFRIDYALGFQEGNQQVKHGVRIGLGF